MLNCDWLVVDLAVQEYPENHGVGWWKNAIANAHTRPKCPR